MSTESCISCLSGMLASEINNFEEDFDCVKKVFLIVKHYTHLLVLPFGTEFIGGEVRFSDSVETESCQQISNTCIMASPNMLYYMINKNSTLETLENA
jgi:hypothetical protein